MTGSHVNKPRNGRKRATTDREPKGIDRFGKKIRGKLHQTLLLCCQKVLTKPYLPGPFVDCFKKLVQETVKPRRSYGRYRMYGFQNTKVSPNKIGQIQCGQMIQTLR
ncbi:hypothetical protein Trydic_g21574 [Trypoxylus dichotomus]